MCNILSLVMVNKLNDIKLVLLTFVLGNDKMMIFFSYNGYASRLN